MDIYLVQRVERKWGDVKTPTQIQNDPTLTMDSVYGMDYMGSAEFEFGALPKSLKTILAEHASGHSPIVAWNTGIKNRDGKTVFVVSGDRLSGNETIKEFVNHQITLDYRNTNRDFKVYPLKEGTRMFEAMGECTDHRHEWCEKLVVWWDIVNNYFICRDKTEARRLEAVLMNTLAKFKEAGKIAA